MTIVDLISILEGTVGILLTIGIFYIQKRLSDRQEALSRDMGELELREKLGPIQFRVMQLRIDTRRLGNHSVELQGALNYLTSRPKIRDRIEPLVSQVIETALHDIVSIADKEKYLEHVYALQGESRLRHQLLELDERIEQYQTSPNIDPNDQLQFDKCQSQVRGMIEAAEQLAQDAVFLLTDSRAVEAVYSYATPETKSELGGLLSAYWNDPFDRVAAPPIYKRGTFGRRPLFETLSIEAPSIAASIRESMRPR